MNGLKHNKLIYKYSIVYSMGNLIRSFDTIILHLSLELT